MEARLFTSDQSEKLSQGRVRRRKLYCCIQTAMCSARRTEPTQFFLPYCIALEQPPSVHSGYKPPQQFRIALEQLWHKYKHNPTTDIPLPFWIYQQHAEIPQIRAFQLCWEILYILNNNKKGLPAGTQGLSSKVFNLPSLSLDELRWVTPRWKALRP